jgi:hypothetical protein
MQSISNAALVALPVFVAKEPLVELAGWIPRQFVPEVH